VEDYQLIYDASAPGFQLAPALFVVLFPIVFAACFYFVESLAGRVSLRIKVLTWGGYGLYALIVVAGYWMTWQSRSDALNVTDAKVVVGNLADGWVRTKVQRRHTETYRHFTVKGIEFLQRDRGTTMIDSLFPSTDPPALPLIEGARVRVTYHGEGEDRTILKFEIAANALTSGSVD
jgi:hypothetical protein